MGHQRKSNLDVLEHRLTGPKRIGLFGHRAVGKTTLLAMFYREASMGRVPGTRLAAIDPKGAEYLAEKIAQIEAGEPLAGTLAETELTLRLYRGPARLDLIVKDYQGEHVTLGTEAPIQAFFADCDAVLLCLDPEGSGSSADRRRRQQEVENLLERYIDRSDDATADRPVALLLTKYDRVLARGGPGPEGVEQLVEQRYGMTRHALASHVPRSAIFAVSSFGLDAPADGRPPVELHPMGLDQPLAWLAEELEAIDREQLEWIWDLAPEDLPRLSRCVRAYERRYPRSDRLIDYRRRLKALRRRRFGKGVLRLAATLTLLVGGLAAYDAWGFHQANVFERVESSSPKAVHQRWGDFLTWHPTQPLFWPSESRLAREKFEQWRLKSYQRRAEIGVSSAADREDILRIKEESPRHDEMIQQVESVLERQEHDRLWKGIKAEALLPSQDADARLATLRSFIHENQESPHLQEALAMAADLQREVGEHQASIDQQELDGLRRDARLPDPDYLDLIDRTRGFLDARPDSRYRSEASSMLDEFIAKLDERDFDRARGYAEANPLNFQMQIQRYQDYLRSHQDGGAYIREATQAIDQIERRRDTHLYRLAYDHLIAHPQDVPQVAQLFRSYLDASPNGQYVDDAKQYLDWWKQISAKAEYRVTLKRGVLSEEFVGAKPDLSVTIWVAGVKHGPSPTIPDTNNPVWNYTFPRPIEWKYGDPVTIQVTKHGFWSSSELLTLESSQGDPLAIRDLSGVVRPGKKRHLAAIEFASTFQKPRLTRPAADR